VYWAYRYTSALHLSVRLVTVNDEGRTVQMVHCSPRAVREEPQDVLMFAKQGHAYGTILATGGKYDISDRRFGSETGILQVIQPHSLVHRCILSADEVQLSQDGVSDTYNTDLSD